MTNPIAPPSITPMPPAPLPTDTPEEFDAKAYATAAAQERLSNELNGANAATYQNAIAAKEGADVATAQAAAASAIAGAQKWVSGTNYPQGAAAWSPVDFQTYRRKVGGVSVVDPSNDSDGWAPVGTPSLPFKNKKLLAQIQSIALFY